MEFDFTTSLFISVLIFMVAALYSSVGHGGASGYLAVLSFFAVPPAQMSTTALVLNVLVAGLALISYARARHLSLKFACPFILASVPAAFLGGLMRVSENVYFILLAAVLIFAALRLAFSINHQGEEPTNDEVKIAIALPVGGGIGMLSGIVGVGGGIFLSPLMLLMKWASTKQTAAVSSFFILVNSLAGLGGRMVRGTLDISANALLLIAAFGGGVVGSYFGAKKFSGLTLRRLLAIVLLVAAAKLIGTLL